VWDEPRPAAAPVTCPDCGRPVAPAAKLCPHCGYPLLFEAGTQAAEPPPGYLRKPSTPDTVREPAPPPGGYQGTVAPRQQAAPGPLCPACGHRNPAHRVRCEVCAAELWPGAATPGPGPAFPVRPPATTVAHRRFPWAAVLFVGVAVAAVAAVYFLAYALA
jgi:ribosomal protein L32